MVTLTLMQTMDLEPFLSFAFSCVNIYITFVAMYFNFASKQTRNLTLCVNGPLSYCKLFKVILVPLSMRNTWPISFLSCPGSPSSSNISLTKSCTICIIRLKRVNARSEIWLIVLHLVCIIVLRCDHCWIVDHWLILNRYCSVVSSLIKNLLYRSNLPLHICLDNIHLVWDQTLAECLLSLWLQYDTMSGRCPESSTNEDQKKGTEFMNSRQNIFTTFMSQYGYFSHS